jgi:tyrosine-protein phosphatase SIW14
MPRWLRYALGLTLLALMTVGPALYYRAGYHHAKRLRVVTAGKMYRSGQLTANGFRDAHSLYQFKTVINFQEENRDPKLPDGYFGSPKYLESEFLSKMGVQYRFLHLQIQPRIHAEKNPRMQAVEEFLEICDDPKNYPILIHCKAGLHRTGLLTAIYRIEYEGWSKADALREVRSNGFGDHNCNTSDENVYQILGLYTPRRERTPVPVQPVSRPKERQP